MAHSRSWAIQGDGTRKRYGESSALVGDSLHWKTWFPANFETSMARPNMNAFLPVILTRVLG